MSMEMFLQSNPYVRQLLAEADCLGMREYIMEQVTAFRPPPPPPPPPSLIEKAY